MKNTNIIINQVAKKILDLDEAVDLLVESNNTLPSFSRGEKVYVAHGPGAGLYAKFDKELNGGFANVKNPSSGTYYMVPTVFLQKTLQKAG